MFRLLKVYYQINTRYIVSIVLVIGESYRKVALNSIILFSTRSNSGINYKKI